jgi:hypothetical protein
MAKQLRIKRYASEKQAIMVRTDACNLAAQVVAGEEINPARLLALCIFFETYIADGSKYVENTMHLMEPDKASPLNRSVVRLITRDD